MLTLDIFHEDWVWVIIDNLLPNVYSIGASHPAVGCPGGRMRSTLLLVERGVIVVPRTVPVGPEMWRKLALLWRNYGKPVKTASGPRSCESFHFQNKLLEGYLILYTRGVGRWFPLYSHL